MGIKTLWSKLTRSWSQSWPRGAIILIILIGWVILRLLIVRFVILEPWRGILVDSEQYLDLARNLLRDGSYESMSNPSLDLFRTPGYPAFLALILGITGDSLRAVVIIQFFLVVITAYLLYEIGRSIGKKKVGVLAGSMLLLSPNALFWSITIMTETLFSAGLILAFLWMAKSLNGTFPIWPTGLLLGFLTLIRPIGIFMILIWVVCFAIFNLKRLGALGSLQKAAVFFLASILVLIPWYIRNAEKHGMLTLSNVNRVTLYSYHLSLTLVEEKDISWDEAKAEIDTMGGAMVAAPQIILHFPTSFLQVQIQGIVRTILGTESETWIWLVSESHTTYLGESLLEPLLQFKFSSVIERLKNTIDEGHLSSILLDSWGFGFTLLLIGSSVIGTIRGLKRGDQNLQAFILLAVLTIAYMVLSPGAAGEARFRVPVEPLLALLAAFAFWKMPSKVDKAPQTIHNLDRY